ncbi:MAG: iron-only hydrogenase system regulator [Lachnospiraceae bacterium]|nr:iron-only hydrogenase system regulator [Lachnospiraceae bacterium]
MDTRVAIVGIILDDRSSAAEVNRILSEYGDYVIGRMGIPYKARGENIISLVMDAPMDVVNTLSGKLGKLPGISTKTIYAKENN